MNQYRFSLGNSTTGAVGLALSVEADTKEEAVKFIRYELGFANDGIKVTLDSPVLSHAVLFINTDKISVDDIEEFKEQEDSNSADGSSEILD